MSKEAKTTNATFVRDVFEYMRYQYPSANPFRQRWVEVDVFDTQGKELHAGSRLEVVRR